MFTGAARHRGKRRRYEVVLEEFLQEESGQDLIEYTLLLAFVALASASLFMSAGNSITFDLAVRQATSCRTPRFRPVSAVAGRSPARPGAIMNCIKG